MISLPQVISAGRFQVKSVEKTAVDTATVATSEPQTASAAATTVVTSDLQDLQAKLAQLIPTTSTTYTDIPAGSTPPPPHTPVGVVGQRDIGDLQVQ